MELPKEGVGKIHRLGEIADWEKELLDACLKDLAANIKKVHHPMSGLLINRERTLLLLILKKLNFDEIFLSFVRLDR